MNKIWNLPLVEIMPLAALADTRPALMVTSAPAWNAVKGQLGGLHLAACLEVTEATTAHWDQLASGLEPSALEVVYAAGGGLAADAGKYLAYTLGLPLIMLPTALSVDAFLTSASGIRRDGCVYYIETTVPGRLVFDLDTIARAPASVRAAGITDVLSIATGSWDWQFAEQHGKNPPGMAFLPWAYAAAQSILQGALDCAEAAGRGDQEGLKTLFDCLALEVQLCNQLGHARPEEGSEHYFAYCAENFTGYGMPHGDLVGPGILAINRLQGQDTSRLEAALRACHIPLDRIRPAVMEQTFHSLPDYCYRHGLAFGLAHTLTGAKATENNTISGDEP